MKITLQPTGTLEKVNGQQCRLWKGESDKGAKIVAFIAMVITEGATPEQSADFERELREVKAERQLVSFDHRML